MFRALLDWLARRQRRECTEEMELRLTYPPDLHLVEPCDVRTATREDFPDIDDDTWKWMVNAMEGKDGDN